MSLQERTLVVKNFDPDKTTNKLLKELCIQAGPVRNVVVKPDHAFVEYEDIESVGYAKALLDGINFHGRKLILEPKVRCNITMKHTKILQDYINYDKGQRAIQQHQLQLQQQQQQQQQQMMAYYQQQNYQQQLSQPSQQTFNPTLQFPVNLINNQVPNPQIFTTLPMVNTSQASVPIQQNQQHQHNQQQQHHQQQQPQQQQQSKPQYIPDSITPLHQPFQAPTQTYQQPSTSFKSNPNNIGRSRSFNHRQNNTNFNRQRSSEWSRRRR